MQIAFFVISAVFIYEPYAQIFLYLNRFYHIKENGSRCRFPAFLRYHIRKSYDIKLLEYLQTLGKNHLAIN